MGLVLGIIAALKRDTIFDTIATIISVIGVSLSMFTMASIARFTRSEMIEVLDSDYMLLAESKGISGPALIFRHALRNALIPIITVLAPLIVDLMTGWWSRKFSPSPAWAACW